MKIKVSAGIIGAVLMLSASQSWAVTLKLVIIRISLILFIKRWSSLRKRAKSTLTVILLFVFIQMEHWVLNEKQWS